MDLTKEQIMNAWKDEEYRSSLPQDVQAKIPPRPTAADGAELTDEQLEQAAGGTTPLCGAAAVEVISAGITGGGLSVGLSAAID